MANMSTLEMREYMRNYREKRRQEAREALGGQCARCGTAVALEFDHVDRNTKVDGIANLLTHSKETLNAELAKCQLLCHDCHKEKSIEAGDLAVAQHGSHAMYKNGCRCELCKSANNAYQRNYYAERQDAATYIQVEVILTDLYE